MQRLTITLPRDVAKRIPKAMTRANRKTSHIKFVTDCIEASAGPVAIAGKLGNLMSMATDCGRYGKENDERAINAAIAVAERDAYDQSEAVRSLMDSWGCDCPSLRGCERQCELKRILSSDFTPDDAAIADNTRRQMERTGT